MFPFVLGLDLYYLVDIGAVELMFIHVPYIFT